jgi:macrodomain Ter protein organizer (MatP/YcbG family)
MPRPHPTNELEMVSVRVRSTDVQILDAKAKRQDCTLSDVLRQIIGKAARAEQRRLPDRLEVSK